MKRRTICLLMFRWTDAFGGLPSLCTWGTWLEQNMKSKRSFKKLGRLSHYWLGSILAVPDRLEMCISL